MRLARRLVSAVALGLIGASVGGCGGPPDVPRGTSVAGGGSSAAGVNLARAVRAALARAQVGATEPVGLVRQTLCATAAGEECSATSADTLPLTVRQALRAEIGRCPAIGMVPRVTVRVSTPDRAPAPDLVLVDVQVAGVAPDQTGDAFTFRVRPGPAGTDSVVVREAYHATLAPPSGPRRALALPDDTCGR